MSSTQGPWSGWERSQPRVLTPVHEIPDARREGRAVFQVEIVHPVFAHGMEGFVDDVPQGDFFGQEEQGPAPVPVPGQGHEQAYGLDVGSVGGDGLRVAGCDDPEVVGLSVRFQCAGAVVHVIAVADGLATEALQHPGGHGRHLPIVSGLRVGGAAQLQQASFHQREAPFAHLVQVVGGAGHAGAPGEEQFPQGPVRHPGRFIGEVEAHQEDSFLPEAGLGMQDDLPGPFGGGHQVPAPAILLEDKNGVAGFQIEPESPLGIREGERDAGRRGYAGEPIRIDPDPRDAPVAIGNAPFHRGGGKGDRQQPEGADADHAWTSFCSWARRLSRATRRRVSWATSGFSRASATGCWSRDQVSNSPGL